MINRRNFCLLSGATILSMNRKVIAQTESVLKPKLFQGGNKKVMPYRFFIPANYNARKAYPLAIWLHGVNGRGKDNLAQISAANKFGSHFWTLPENQAKNPCFVVVPQCAPDMY